MKTSERKTIMEELVDSKEMIRGVVAADDEKMAKVVEDRREEFFEPVWEHTAMPKDEVLELAVERENDYIEMAEEDGIAEGLPEWLIRADAQETLAQVILDEIQEKLT